MKKLSWHQSSIKEVFSHLNADEAGLTLDEAGARLAKYGPNQLQKKKKEGRLAIFLKQFKSPLIYILLFAAAISFFVGKTTNSLVIFFVLLANSIMGFIQEAKAQSTMDSLQELSSPKAKVIRSNEMQEIPTKDVVPGDIILIESGSRVPADARIIESVRLQADEAALTGESQPVYKVSHKIELEATVADRLNMLFAGTVVSSGRGKAVVVDTGMNTEIGKIATIIQGTSQVKTPFQRRMDAFGKFIVIIVLAQVSLALIVGWFIRRMPFYEIFMVVLSQTVSSIPEGLPVAVTVALAVGMQRMAKKKAFVRRLAAVEGLGSATFICSDKTGTLTQNEMTSRRISTMSSTIEVTGGGYKPEGDFLFENKKFDPLADKESDILLKTAVLCNNAQCNLSPEDNAQLKVSGDPTEIAYLVAAIKAGINIQELIGKLPRVDEIPFESQIQMMATKHKLGESEVFICVKGAPEKIVELCGYYLKEGEPARLEDSLRKEILFNSENMAKDALRVLAFAFYEGGDIDKDKFDWSSLNKKMVFAGLIGNIDPARKEAKEAIKICNHAGIKTIMITGDHLSTAEAVALELGMRNKGDEGITGDLLDHMTDEELEGVVKNFTVFARIEPKHKYHIVKALQRQNEVVAMTGDGVNDAPALAAADIGVAMGITGTDVAKESSSMVIADDNFATIVDAVEEGRGITANMRKTILYLLCSSGTEIIVLMAALSVGMPLPLFALQILWINLVTDGALTINLIMEPKEDVMNHPPDKKDEPILTKRLIKLLFFRAPIMAAGIIGLFVYEMNRGMPLIYCRTVAFTLLAVTQWFNGINCRSDSRSIFKMPFFGNRYLILGLVLAVFLHFGVIYIPFLQNIFSTLALSFKDWLKIIAVGSSIFWLEELRKLIANRRGVSQAKIS
ncbi:MAG: HAD-IC family P-type ATPase [Candidatus Omnitrophica bacterium]|nr:HAD-IC family P-type ATPase [Candidatus Omnitrophota bacterium]